MYKKPLPSLDVPHVLDEGEDESESVEQGEPESEQEEEKQLV